MAAIESARPFVVCLLEPNIQENILVLKELGKADWLRMLNILESRIPTVLILRGTRNLQEQGGCPTHRCKGSSLP